MKRELDEIAGLAREGVRNIEQAMLAAQLLIQYVNHAHPNGAQDVTIDPAQLEIIRKGLRQAHLDATTIAKRADALYDA